MKKLLLSIGLLLSAATFAQTHKVDTIQGLMSYTYIDNFGETVYCSARALFIKDRHYLFHYERLKTNRDSLVLEPLQSLPEYNKVKYFNFYKLPKKERIKL